jgi:hypothetical protein
MGAAGPVRYRDDPLRMRTAVCHRVAKQLLRHGRVDGKARRPGRRSTRPGCGAAARITLAQRTGSHMLGPQRRGRPGSRDQPRARARRRRRAVRRPGALAVLVLAVSGLSRRSRSSRDRRVLQLGQPDPKTTNPGRALAAASVSKRLIGARSHPALTPFHATTSYTTLSDAN